MGYSIKSLPKKKSTPKWKVQFISFKKEDAPDSKAKMPRRAWDIPKNRWQTLGFNSFMTIEEAKARSKQLNAQLLIKRQEERLKKIEEEQSANQLKYDSVLPSEFVAEFEQRFIRKRDSQVEKGLRKNTRAYTTWRAAQRLIVAIGSDPSDWFYETFKFYDYFYHQKMSVRYLQSVLKMANLWGFFFCKKLARPFLPVPLPRGYERMRLIEANCEKQKGVSRASHPLLPEDLLRAMSEINQRNFNWLYLSVWFGLRPQEIDNLHSEDMWRVETLPTGRKVFWVYQTKIIALPPEDRCKPIPIVFEEQELALAIVKSDKFKRPLLKTIKKYFGKKVTLYGGRKGFVDLMFSKGQLFENISIWMGHSTLNRTWRNYKQRRRFHLAGFGL